MANRLAAETSPYLLQHADNPVDWYPWAEEAFTKAQVEDKPILLSVGYAACHWCHVMAHESFEDPDTAAIMNQYFVNVKVDREERPDIDSIYMNAVVGMTGQGGWPMTVFLTPKGEPFYAGTYFPPVRRFNMPGFTEVLFGVVRAWQEKRKDVQAQAAQVVKHLGNTANAVSEKPMVDGELLKKAVLGMKDQFEPKKGGFGQAPKFPQAMAIEFLLRQYLKTQDKNALHMAEYTLQQMAYGGMYDQLGGGFARYSTDNDWLVPHFEKMLYDNALLSRVYLHAWKMTGRTLYRRVVEETLDWVLTEMSHEEGGFYSSLDADSEGEEGKFYVWQEDEVRELLAGDAEPFLFYYGVTESGNWEGKNILHVALDLNEVARNVGLEGSTLVEILNRGRKTLYHARAQRVWPGRDEKVLTAWNGLMMASFAEAGRDLGRPDYIKTAMTNAEFLYRNLRLETGRLKRSWKEGHEAKYNGYLEDYAFLADGLLALYQSTFDERWYTWIEELADLILSHFRDEENGGFFDTSDDHESLIYRPKDLQDNAIPSGNSAAAMILLQLNLYTGNGNYWEAAEESIAMMYEFMERFPTGFSNWLGATDFMLSVPLEIAIVGDPQATDTQLLLEKAFSNFRPNQVVAVGHDSSHIPLMKDRERRDNKATAYVCRHFVCQQPVTDPLDLEYQLI